MKVLIVEDQPETVRDIIAHCDDNAWDTDIVDFEGFDNQYEELSPDVVVLDWRNDATGIWDGDQVLERIWATGFKPIIIFSGIEGAISLDEKYKASNLVKLQSKGDEQPVIVYLDQISAFVPAISTLKGSFNDALIQSLNAIDMMSKTGPLDESVMRYVFARRVSTYFDEECGDAAPPAWIQYTYPPISKTLCVCDIIRSFESEDDIDVPGLPNEYAVVLTPSCDIAQGKAAKVLCARCSPKTDFHGLGMNAKKDQIKRVVSDLHAGYKGSLVPLPSIPCVMPYLTVKLKELEFNPIEQIALRKDDLSSQSRFYRVASIESPFREQIVWAHMINACRPGVPDRDMELWAKELVLP